MKKTHWLYEVELSVGQYRLGASGNDESFFNNLKDPVGTLDAILPSHYAGPDVVWWYFIVVNKSASVHNKLERGRTYDNRDVLKQKDSFCGKAGDS